MGSLLEISLGIKQVKWDAEQLSEDEQALMFFRGERG
jgi:hypothetical protein